MSNLSISNFDTITEKSAFFQTAHVWPLSDELNFVGWLNNFEEGQDRNIACHILNFFMYLPEKMVDKMLQTSVGRAGYHLAQFYPSWNHSDFKTSCYYSYIPGEKPSITDSGNLFARKLRDKLQIPEDRLIPFQNVEGLLESSSNPILIVLVDDFVGSGAQCITALGRPFPGNKEILLTTAKNRGHKFIYAPLIINGLGFTRLSPLDDLILSPAHVLGTEYNLFNENCVCWKNDEELFKLGIELIERKSLEIGIIDTDGRSTTDLKGFGKQGLAIAFNHGIPDASIPLFYWKENGWIPLKEKTY